MPSATFDSIGIFWVETLNFANKFIKLLNTVVWLLNAQLHAMVRLPTNQMSSNNVRFIWIFQALLSFLIVKYMYASSLENIFPNRGQIFGGL